jgi:hypothetical protein
MLYQASAGSAERQGSRRQKTLARVLGPRDPPVVRDLAQHHCLAWTVCQVWVQHAAAWVHTWMVQPARPASVVALGNVRRQ